MVRDLVGNPFRPSTLDPAWVGWDGGTVRRLARGIYESRQFELMPVLADALEEAGCQDPELVGHCRGPGPHVLGCWALDQLLEKV
jgi:hypothetical protein